MAKNNAVEVLTQAKNEIRRVFDSENYKECLQVMGKFHNYSIRNIMLIKAERPDATYVAGYQAWKKEFGRHVKKGERGIPIIAWAPTSRYTEETVKNENGQEETKLVKTTVPNFRVVYVYDVSQTDGDPLPKLTERLVGDMENYNMLFQSIRDISPYKLQIREIKGEASGYCSPDDKEIVVREGMSQRHTIKTSIHEVAHAYMHTDEDELKKIGLDKNTIEVEAEATAFVVCEHFGMDTSSYSFPYIASWSSGKELKELESSLDRIQHSASDIITKIEARYLELAPPEPEVNRSVKPKMAEALTADHMLTAEQIKACVSYDLPVGYFVAQDRETGRQFSDIKMLAELSSEEFDERYEHVYKDVKLISQVQKGQGTDGFCYPENGCISPTINPYVMNPGEAATTKFLLGEFMKSDDWEKIDESLKHNAPVRYADMIQARDKYLGEEYFAEAAKNYPDKTPDEIRNLAGYLTITDGSREVFLPGHRGAWHITDAEKIYGENYYMMYNKDSKADRVIVDSHGKILMDRRCNFDDLKDRLEEEARMNRHPESKSKKKSRETEKGR